MRHKGRREKKRFKECAEIVRAANTRGEPRSCSTMQTGLSTMSRDLRRPLGELKKRVADTHIRKSVQQTTADPAPRRRSRTGGKGG